MSPVEAVCASFARQRMMDTLGAELATVEPGHVEIVLPFDAALTQQHGTLHAGAIAAVADSACGYAALSVQSVGAEVLTVEFKLNLLEPATGSAFRARGRVVRPGRRLVVTTADVTTENHDPTLIATMTATLYVLRADRDH